MVIHKEDELGMWEARHGDKALTWNSGNCGVLLFGISEGPSRICTLQNNITEFNKRFTL